jgi:F-type H+-transporting ATPase subunit b
MATGGESWLSWVFKFVNFAILIGILIKFAGKPLKDYFYNRHKGIKDKLEQAEKMLQEAENLRKEYMEKLAGFDREIDAYKKVIYEKMANDARKMSIETMELVFRIRNQATLTYEQEVKETQYKIKEEIAKLTVERAERLIVERLNKNDHDSIVEEFIDKLRSLN